MLRFILYRSVFKDLMKACLLILIKISCCIITYAQLPVTIPWSSSLNLTFGNGTDNPGPL